LAGLANFDGNYLNMPQLLSHWQVKIDSASTPAKPWPATCQPPTAASRLSSENWSGPAQVQPSCAAASLPRAVL
ncbi:hypothetical protein, partial [Reyranella soli]|uniref:hypothetical protein n=1 Tax=Reyranella soli TaxID=1230389 RepID=UPI001C3FF63C